MEPVRNPTKDSRINLIAHPRIVLNDVQSMPMHYIERPLKFRLVRLHDII